MGLEVGPVLNCTALPFTGNGMGRCEAGKQQEDARIRTGQDKGGHQKQNPYDLLNPTPLINKYNFRIKLYFII